MIKLSEVRTTKLVHKFWTVLLNYMQSVNRLDDASVRRELNHLISKVPSSGPIIAGKYKKVEQAYKKFKTELQSFNAYVRNKSYD